MTMTVIVERVSVTLPIIAREDLTCATVYDNSNILSVRCGIIWRVAVVTN